jgi:radical SAM protein with 4Fe4S-binding SPASM domain
VKQEVEPPSFLQIEPVGQCNLACKMCAIPYRGEGTPHGPPAFMAWPIFVSVLDAFGEARELHLQGLGEPLMHPRFFDMVRRAAGRGLRVSTNTNLTLIDRRRAEECMTSGLAEISLSIDAATREAYEAIRVGARFDWILANLAKLEAAREAAAGSGPALRLVMVLMRRNLEEIPGLVRLAHDFGIEALFVQRLCHDLGEGTLPERYAPLRGFVDAESLPETVAPPVVEVFREAEDLAAELGVELRLPQPGTGRPTGARGRDRCDWPWRGPYVAWDGRVMPCCMVATPDRACLGNVREQEPLEVWNGAAYREFRTRLDSDGPPRVCRSCAVYSGTF